MQPKAQEAWHLGGVSWVSTGGTGTSHVIVIFPPSCQHLKTGCHRIRSAIRRHVCLGIVGPKSDPYFETNGLTA